jgi:diadenosine tetraphosphate (Ap4A) HIT family hydrolase
MSETPEQFYERVSGSIRRPALEEWDTFPFEGDIRPRTLERPSPQDVSRSGRGGIDCEGCTTPDEKFLWTDANWRVRPTAEPSGLPLVLFLEPRQHFGEPGELPDDLAAECGVMIGRVDRAISSIDGIERVHVCRWGEGSEHLHWWFIARPSRMLQLASSFAEIWDDMLPPTPQAIWDSNLAHVRSALGGP